MSRVEAQNIWKIYPPNVEAVKGINFVCEDREFIAILGPSGCGKSSTLRMIAGLEEISEGSLKFDEETVNNLSPKDRNIALAFESYALYAPLTVYENIAYPLRARKLDRLSIDRKVREMSDQLQLTDVLFRKPGKLSGGQKQRVSLARALVRDPKVFLLDEPLSHMDKNVRVILRARIRRIHDELGATSIYVTHDQEEALSLADRIIVMNLGEIQQIGTTDDLWNAPANKFVAGFIGEPVMNFLKATVESENKVRLGSGEGSVGLRCGRKIYGDFVGKEVTLGIRPQRISLISEERTENTVNGKVLVVEPVGEEKIITLEVFGTELKVIVKRDVLVQPEQSLDLEFGAEHINLFSTDGEEKSILN